MTSHTSPTPQRNPTTTPPARLTVEHVHGHGGLRQVGKGARVVPGVNGAGVRDEEPTQRTSCRHIRLHAATLTIHCLQSVLLKTTKLLTAMT